ncbi:helix-turn-helix domain-containing protein [Streptomyces sp. NPDC053499]|uniref:helix-turn-helix domain-containing protein n=1 Tax=Streptomyces sp. NPDC053499 TaxID=3365707 RepID=UPI0037D609BC
MLDSSKQCNDFSHEVDVSTNAPMYKLLDSDLLRRLMERTGTGASMSIRGLSAASGVPRSTIHNLLTGAQQSIPSDTAHALARAIGVDLLILFAPVGRSVPIEAVPTPPAVSA